MKVLSIDWDFFQNVDKKTLRFYPDGLDNPTKVTEIIWGAKYAENGDELREVTLSENEYERMIELLSKQNEDCSVMIANSHVHIYDFIHEHLSEDEKVNLVNVDMHHDMINDNDKTDCGNWIGQLLKEKALEQLGFKWISNEISFDMYGIGDGENKKFDMLMNILNAGNSLKAIEDEQYDLIYLARSDTWSPPHLDPYFCSLVDFMKEHFLEIKIERDIDKPRTEYLVYEEDLKQMKKERELI